MITEKYAEAYRKEYEKDAAGNVPGVYKDKDAYLADCFHTYENYCAGKPPDVQVRKWLALLGSPNLLGFKTAFLSSSPELLNDALYQSAAIGHAQKIWATGFDHCANVWTALDALAAGMNERVPLLLPEDLGMSSNGHSVTVAAANLLMAVWYGRKDFEEDGRKKAEQALGTKQPASDHAVIRYLAAILDGDAAEAGVQLDLYCRGVSGMRDFGLTKLEKMFWPRAHGLYNLAFAVWKKEKAMTVPVPEPDCFCKDLAQWQTEHDFSPGRLFIEYPEPMGLVNKILYCTPPKYTLHQPYLDTKKSYKNQRFAFAERFREQMVEKVMEDVR